VCVCVCVCVCVYGLSVWLYVELCLWGFVCLRVCVRMCVHALLMNSDAASGSALSVKLDSI
jgi:hypothetical protein